MIKNSTTTGRRAFNGGDVPLWWRMDKSKYWNDRLSITAGPGWDEQIVLTNEDGIGRPATSSELREAAQYLDWVSHHIGKDAGG